ncbi:MAG: hypothetical protein RBT46_05125 [Weeksellaceae bacterium]|jgi:hypothetical protein|nr:hypothetical protein [Weeksellaceae bacterium]MDX9705070.1 hypothetical protein [Weeksellaceae bacterium]
MKNIYLFMLFICATSVASAQGFHTSTTNIEYENGSLKITAKFFTEDLESVVGASVSNRDAFDAKAKTYTQSNLNVKINGQNATLSYIGSQTNDKSTRLYLKIDGVSTIKEIEVNNQMLIEKFSDQQNLVTFDIKGVRKSFTTRKGNTTGKLTF